MQIWEAAVVAAAVVAPVILSNFFNHSSCQFMISLWAHLDFVGL
jgi:hypothetical protein